MYNTTISWDDERKAVVFVDQTLLPGRVEIIYCTTVERLVSAIRRLEIRGAPALGVAGGYGIVLAAARWAGDDREALGAHLEKSGEALRSTRPTAVNLSWGTDRVLARAREGKSTGEVRELTLAEATAIAREDATMCHRIGDYGAALLPSSCTILTHCNAGALACSEWGTALGVIRSAVKAGKEVRVYACETRPLNQGSRLTAWELARDGIDVRVITDGSAAYLMRRGEIDAVIVGADRITRDAVFNKIGTYMHAVCAHHHSIPFYVAAPSSTFDTGCEEDAITIEERSREEIAFCGERQLVPDGVPTLNLAFDATPIELVTAIITDRGILKSPFFEENMPLR